MLEEKTAGGPGQSQSGGRGKHDDQSADHQPAICSGDGAICSGELRPVELSQDRDEWQKKEEAYTQRRKRYLMWPGPWC